MRVDVSHSEPGYRVATVMAAPLANASVDRRCAAQCAQYAQARASNWRSRRGNAASTSPLGPHRIVLLRAHQRTERVDREILRVLVHDLAGHRLPMTSIPKTFQTIALEDVADAISRLEDEGVVEIRENHLELSSCARRIAELGLLTA